MARDNLRTLLYLLVVGALLISACGTTPTVVETKEQALVTNPTPTQVPTRTPAPTARPLAVQEERDGLYENAILGVAFEYPPEWTVEISPSDGYDFVIVSPREGGFAVFLETGAMETGTDFELVAEEFFTWLSQNINIEQAPDFTMDPDYVLADGSDSWKGEGVGIDLDTQDTVLFETIAAKRANHIFMMTLIALEEPYNVYETELEDVRKSFRVFTPQPYGVDRQNALFLVGGEPETLDPAKWHFGADSVLGDLFSGLVKLDVDLRPVPDLAESWSVSENGLVYTFKLRQDVTFHTGRSFTADDVKFSWERACHPDTESDTAETYLGDILGVTDVLNGEAEEISGLKIIDDYTLEVTLDEPKAYFIYKLAYVAAWIVDRETVDQIEENPIGTGPFKLVKYEEEEILILARNENYHRNFVNLEYVVYLLYQGPAIRLYESGDIDMVYIDENLLDRAEDPNDLLYGNVQPLHELCTRYVVFDTSQPPFDDKLIREAFTKAIDRERYNEITQEGKGVIAKGLYPPGLPGYNNDVQPIPYDIDQSVSAFEASSYGSVDELPEIVITVSGEGGDLSTSDALLIQMWEEALGVTIRVEQIDYESFWDEVYAGNHGQILTLGWCADYPDPQNFADILFHTGSEMNHSKYSNPELDVMLEQARAMQDTSARLSLYQEIEQIIIDDMPVAFLMHESRPLFLVQKPYVEGYFTTPIGIAQLMNVSIGDIE